MSKREKLGRTAAGLLIAAVLLAGLAGLAARALAQRRASERERMVTTGVAFIMDTFIEYEFFGENGPQAKDAVDAALRDIENRMSMYIDNSEIAALNQNAGKAFVPLSEDTYELLERCAAYGAETDGVFDVTIAPVARVWGITRGRAYIPDSAEIASQLELVNYRDILLEPETRSAMLRREGQSVDLGGIAKGFACSAADRIARENGIESGFISIGGNIMTIGQKPVADQTGRTVRQPFRFGLRDPRGSENDYIAAVLLEDATMATSGDYERYFMNDNVRYHHILDPATGYPARTDLMSVSVVSQDGAFADFMSTWLFIKGRSFVLERLNSLGCGLIVVDQDKNIYITENLRERVVPADKSGTYTFISGGTT
ncbi:FAD:protein FMN transferase [Anaerotruncus colihominis]|uniref:FAD:protein FMN transferase n=1 Tax=Anaerotruncus colihominis TaxID=169435 RepID=UPI00351418BD